MSAFILGALVLGWMLVCLVAAVSSLDAELGEGSRVAYNGTPTDADCRCGPLGEDDEIDEEHSWLTGLWGTVVGRAPHATANGPGDELWLVALPSGEVMDLWTEELVVRPESRLATVTRRWLRR